MTIELDQLGLTAPNILGFLLVLGRLSGLMLVAPLYGGRVIPMPVKLALAFIFALSLLPVADPPDSLAQADVGTLAALMFKEIMLGVALGLAVALVTLAWQIAGSLLDLSVGFSYGGVLDPVTGNQTPQLQQLYGLLAVMLFLLLDGHELMLAALAKSFSLVALDQMVPEESFAKLILSVTLEMFRLGIGVCAPVLIALLLADLAFALVARVAPQTQIIQVEFAVKIPLALFAVAATLSFFAPVFSRGLREGLGLVVGVTP